MHPNMSRDEERQGSRDAERQGGAFSAQERLGPQATPIPLSLPPGAASFAKIGGVYVPIEPDGRPMMELLSPEQQAVVRATIGSPYNKCIQAGLFCCILEFMLCPCIMVPCFLCSLRKAADVERRLREEAVASLMTQQQLQEAGIAPHAAAGAYPMVLPHIAAMAAARRGRGGAAGPAGAAPGTTTTAATGAGLGARAPAAAGEPAEAGDAIPPATAAAADTEYEPAVDRVAEEAAAPASGQAGSPAAAECGADMPALAAAIVETVVVQPAEAVQYAAMQATSAGAQGGPRSDEERAGWE